MNVDGGSCGCSRGKAKRKKILAGSHLDEPGTIVPLRGLATRKNRKKVTSKWISEQRHCGPAHYSDRFIRFTVLCKVLFNLLILYLQGPILSLSPSMACADSRYWFKSRHPSGLDLLPSARHRTSLPARRTPRRRFGVSAGDTSSWPGIGDRLTRPSVWYPTGVGIKLGQPQC